MVKKHQKEVAGIEDQIIALYAKWVTVRDIQAHFNQLYGVDVSPTIISNVTNKIMSLIRDWQSRPLQKVYAAVFLDAIHFKVKQEGHIVNKVAYMVIGIDLDGCQDVLGMWIGEHETSKFWLAVLNELKNHDVEDILICGVDNLAGFSEAVVACFHDTEIQKCIVHQIRNSIRYVSYSGENSLAAFLKNPKNRAFIKERHSRSLSPLRGFVRSFAPLPYHKVAWLWTYLLLPLIKMPDDGIGCRQAVADKFVRRL